MSDVLYPISMIDSLVSTPFAPVVADEFRVGTTSTRLNWTAQYFKRQFQLRHAPLTLQEFQYLRSFYSQRSGLYDYFWFRDNVHQEGNAKVRFSQPLPRQFQGSARILQVEMEEVAPVRALVEWDEVLAAAGTAPAFWWDPCRELYYSHLGSIISASQVNDFYVPNGSSTIPAVLQAGVFTDVFKGTVEQSQYFRANGTAWAKTSANLAGITGSQPAVSLFCFARHSANLNHQCFFSVGAAGTGTCIGLGMDNTGAYSIYSGSNATNYGLVANSPVDTWRSIAVTTTLNVNEFKMHINGGVGSQELSTRSYSAGPATLFANASGSAVANPSGSGAKSDLAQCMIFVGVQLNQTQIKALHNLFCSLYGVASV